MAASRRDCVPPVFVSVRRPREKVLRYAWSVVRVKVSTWYKCYWVVLARALGDCLRVGAPWVARYDQIKKYVAHALSARTPVLGYCVVTDNRV